MAMRRWARLTPSIVATSVSMIGAPGARLPETMSWRRRSCASAIRSLRTIGAARWRSGFRLRRELVTCGGGNELGTKALQLGSNIGRKQEQVVSFDHFRLT